jgi:hypothetical protein
MSSKSGVFVIAFVKEDLNQCFNNKLAFLLQRFCLMICQGIKILTMKGIFIALFLFVFAGCTREDGINAWRSYMTFTSVTTPATVIKGNDIVSQVRASAPNLCYSFKAFEVTEKAVREYEIRAKANHPSASQGVVCAEALYTIDTTFKMNAADNGQYILHFYNDNALFKSDTVVVN